MNNHHQQQGLLSLSSSSSYSFNASGSNGTHHSLAPSQYSSTSSNNSGNNAASQPVLSLLRKLIQINIPKSRNQSNDDYERYVNKQLRFLISLLSSRISPTLIQTQDQILLTETIKKRCKCIAIIICSLMLFPTHHHIVKYSK